MPYVPGKPLPARFIDLPDGHKAFTYICGNSLCRTNALKEAMFVPPHLEPFPIIPIPFMGWFMGLNPKNGKKQFAIFSECRPQPIEFPTVKFVLKDVWLDYYHVGITDVLRIKFVSFANYPGAVHCFDQDPANACPFVYLNWGGGRSWTGTFHLRGGAALNVSLTLTDTQDPDRPLIDGWPAVRKWEITFSGCIGPPVTLQAHATCYFPLTLGGQGFALPLDCCPDGGLPPDMGFAIEGFTNRFMPARFVDRVAGKKRFMSIRCCDSDSRCELAECCGCEVSPYRWSVPIAGIINGPGPPAPGTVCPSMNGDVILTFLQHLGGSDCQWTGDLGSGQWALQCSAADGVYRLSVSGTGPTTAVWEAPIAGWNCLGANTMTLVSVGGFACLGYPGSVIVSPA